MTMPTQFTTRWMHFEEIPADPVRDPEHGEVTGFQTWLSGWPGVTWREEAHRIVTGFDNGCALTDLMDDGAGQMCSNPVGFYLREYEDDQGRERAEQVYAAFVLVETYPGGPVVAVCEDCGPGALYGEADAARKAVEARTLDAGRAGPVAPSQPL